MFDNLTNLGVGVMIFAMIIGVASIVLFQFGASTAGCTTAYPWNASSQTCMNTTGGTLTETGSLTNTKYLLNQVGTTGLAGWTPAIIAFAVGMLFIGGILTLRGRNSKGRY